MANTGTKNKILSLSPYVELFVRYIYWKNILFFSKYSTPKKKYIPNNITNFSKIIDYLKNYGIQNGDTLLVHSSYGNLKCTQKKPTEIISELTNLIGKNGTLVMPAIRKYDEEPNKKDYLHSDLSNIISTYNVKESKVFTGILPSTMLQMENAVISRFPTNTLVAIGPLSQKMMENNLSGYLPTPCGPNSSWKFCLDNDSYIIGLGVDLTSCLTMIHLAEDIDEERWPIKNWYRTRTFKIIDKDFEDTITIKERHPKWGALHWAGRTLCKDLIKNDILHSIKIDGILVEIIRSKELISFLNSKNEKGYPYFCVKKHLK